MTENAATAESGGHSGAESPAAAATAAPVAPTLAPPTPTPTAEAATPTPVPTPALSRFPKPPTEFSGEPHFYFGPPVGEGGSLVIDRTYRYGSTAGHTYETHHGVEFPNPFGAPVVAVAPGAVYFAGSDAETLFGPTPDFYGNLVVLRLDETWQGRTVYALYAHLSQVTAQTGQVVSRGEALGAVGDSGIARGPHLHLEVRLDQPESYWESRNPELWLAPPPETGSLAVRVANERNQYLPGMRVGIICEDGAYHFLDTYWDNGVNPDDAYGENAALTGLPALFCRFETTIEGKKIEKTATIQAGGLTFIWLHP